MADAHDDITQAAALWWSRRASNRQAVQVHATFAAPAADLPSNEQMNGFAGRPSSTRSPAD
jgi:hypothetical protein